MELLYHLFFCKKIVRFFYIAGFVGTFDRLTLVVGQNSIYALARGNIGFDSARFRCRISKFRSFGRSCTLCLHGQPWTLAVSGTLESSSYDEQCMLVVRYETWNKLHKKFINIFDKAYIVE